VVSAKTKRPAPVRERGAWWSNRRDERRGQRDTATMRRRPQEGCVRATATLQKQALHGALVRRRLRESEARDAEDEEQRP